MSIRADVGNLDDLLPSWISNHLGEKSYMADEVTQLPFSSREGPPSLEASPSTTPPQIEKKTNIMTQDELDLLKESHSFPLSVQIRLLEMDETIASICPSEVAFTRLPSMRVFILPSIPSLGEFFISTTFVLLNLSPMRGGVLSARWSCDEHINFPFLNEFRTP